MQELLVSVIIPVYNVEKYLKQCVDSVLNQTYQNLEVILVDDGSTDECPKICDEYAGADNRVVVKHQVNGGAAKARNTGMDLAKGEYVLFLDSDDYWNDAEALYRLIKRIEVTNPDVLNFSYKKCYEDTGKETPQFESVNVDISKNLSKPAQLDLLTGNSLYIASSCNKMIRTKLLKKYMKFQEGNLSEDIEWCARLLCYAQSFDFICENFYCYRQRQQSTTHSINVKSCINLKNNIIQCIKLAEKSEDNIKEYIYRYTAYQLSTFVAVQTFVAEELRECILELDKISWVFAYHGKNKKVTCLYYANKILGFKRMCKVVCWTKKLWVRL